MVFETIVGRSQKDFEKFGKKGSSFIGRYLVIREYDWVLTSKIYFDLLRPHVVLICGKRGTGKSYLAGVILEGFCLLEKEIREKLSFIVFDPIGIYWSMKFPNEAQIDLLKKWNLSPKGFRDIIELYVPEKLVDKYREAGLPVDKGISFSLKDFSIDDWILSFGWDRLSDIALALEKNLADLKKSEKYFDLKDLIQKIEEDRETSEKVKKALITILKVVDEWGIFSKKGIKIEELAKPGKIVIVDTSRINEEAVRTMIAAKISRDVYFSRVKARKEEELAKIEGREPKYKFPLTWLIFEEAHNYIPSEKVVASTEPILTIAKQGREPGIGLLTITQMPNKIHREVLAQTDIVISLRLTAKSDIEALNAIMQTYVEESLEQLFDKLPRIPGAALVLDDSQEKIFSILVRPRISWHAGGTAIVQI